MPDKISSEPKETGLKKSLKLIYVYAIATGAIFTFIGYWDSVFYEYCGNSTWFAFLLMTACIMPVAFVYCELAPLFKTNGGQLIYNTVAINKNVGFFTTWLIILAWVSVPPAAVIAIIQWVFTLFNYSPKFEVVMVLSILFLIGYFFLSLQNAQLAGKIQLAMLITAIVGCIITSIAFMCSGHWNISNFVKGGFFTTQIKPTIGIPGWAIGCALLITPFFGFETVPQMVEEGNFPIKNLTKAIWGSVVTCGAVYVFYFIGLGGLDISSLVEPGGAATDGYLAITIMKQWGNGWVAWSVLFGIAAILCAIGTCLLGFWMSSVRLLHTMGVKHFMPQSFAKCNKHNQPIIPNILLLVISIVFLVLQLLPSTGNLMNNFFNLMAFGCSVAYAVTMISAIIIHKKHPDWKTSFHLPGGQFTRVLAMIIAVVVAFFTTLGQGIGSWVCFGVYFLIGVCLWLWMVKVQWKKEPVIIDTPDGPKEF